MKLAAYLTKHGITPAEFASDLGTTQASVSRYVNGRRFPRPEHLRRIADITGGAVTANDFLTSARQPASETGAAAL